MSITIRELAQLAGTSNATVSMVLSGKDAGRVGKACRENVLALAEKHGYRHNLQARALSEGRTYRISFCIEGKLSEHPIIGGFSLYERLARFSEGIHDGGYAIEIEQTDTSESDADVIRNLTLKNVDGFILFGWQPKLASRVLFSMKEKGLPAIASGTRMEDDDLTWTDIDRTQSSREATHALLKEGHKELVLLNTDDQINSRFLEEGFVQAVSEGSSMNGAERIFRDISSWRQTCQVTNDSLDRYPETTGFLLTDNFYAEAVLEVLHQRELNPGQNCRVIGFGDTVLAERCTPKLSHYSLRIADQVQFGIDALLEQISAPGHYQPRHCFFAPQYIKRDT